MKLNRFFMLGLVGLAFAACGNEDEAENALAQGNGAVSIKIVSPTANSRAVTSDSPDGTIKVTGPATVSLTATFDGEEKIKTIDLARGETEAKFWNVTNPTLVTVSMNDGTKVYTTSINDVTMQVTESIPAYGETKDFTYNNRTGTPTLEDITNGDNTGAKDGDTDKTFFMYEATDCHYLNTSMRKSFIALTFLLVPACLSAQLGGKIYLQRADSLLQRVLSLYEVKKYGLLMETYPRNPKQQITYTANTGSEVTQQEVSFLWPYSAMVSGCVSLYKTSGNKKYKKLMDKQIKPGLDLYWDTTRQPECYQSYPAFAGQNRRYL